MVAMGIFFFYSCSYDTLVPEKINPTTPVSFTNDIQPIFSQNSSPKCTSCHAGSTDPDLREGKSYTSLMNGGFVDTITPANSIIYTEMAANGGMSGYTNPTDAQLVLLWIQQGAKNN